MLIAAPFRGRFIRTMIVFSFYIFLKVYYRVNENEESGKNSNGNETLAVASKPEDSEELVDPEEKLSAVASKLEDSVEPVVPEETLSAVASKLEDSEEPVDPEASETPHSVNDASIGQKKKKKLEAEELGGETTDDKDSPKLVEGIN